MFLRWDLFKRVWVFGEFFGEILSLLDEVVLQVDFLFFVNVADFFFFVDVALN